MTDHVPDTPLIPPENAGEKTSSPAAPAPAAHDAPTPDEILFEGSVSPWMGLKSYCVSGLLVLLGLAAAVYGGVNSNTVVLIIGVALLIASSLMAAYVVLRIRCQRYKITRKLIEREQGLVVKSVDSLDLGRVKDIKLRQGLSDRILNIGTIEIFSSDKTDPILFIESIPNPRPLYEKMRDAIIEIDRKRGVIPMT
ncbi:MAG TPA: PH domain-containing protein [Planctomycetota bacterium]